MSNVLPDEAKVIAAEPPPNPISDTGKFMKELSDEQREILRELRDIRQELQQRETRWRSLLRAVFDAIWSGVTQAHNSLKGIIKE